ncbi:nitrogen utilization protein [Pedobacter ginsenosidimutans]|uniref:Nitrogen utilization protein n=1 Tax=Pedobacter ginsenosidimutans TaxID=687842 RepID=A0A0T5VMD5_9SPHI|nr:transcription antitermination factor NusB [Pedobacter ginsenosidimutans]ARS40574.1 transcription antitermination factor NusB [Sphingobacteriaceae bacterium GW460-11-11-14-LB5]KRT15018.1 nitrogen utilization protein [Pedobacter ginsenosidimutans]
MLNRRHLRIKALQNIFAWHMADKKDIKGDLKTLMQSIDSVYEMYIWMLSLMVEVTEFTANDAAERANKFIKTAEDINPNMKLLHNKFSVLMQQNPEYVSAVKKYKVDWGFDPEIRKTVYNSLKASKEYADYLADPNESLESSKDIIKYIFRKIILKNQAILQVFEEKFINWQVDHEVMKGMVAKTLKNFTSEDPFKNKLTEISADWVEDSKFVQDLFVHTLQNDAKYQEMIADRTKNWESERIALMDTILMKMAICELLNFPSIPVKVTINEYLELSKDYSTPKSNSFINGILDKILGDLKKNNTIKKIGRGLIED